MQTHIELKEERVVTREGTIIPQAIHFDSGNAYVSYHLDRDAHFAPTGASLSRDGGQTWERSETAVHRQVAMGKTGPEAAIVFNQYLFRVGEGEYVAYYATTEDGAESFSRPKLAKFKAHGLVDKPYEQTKSRVQESHHFDIPECYYEVVKSHGAVIGAVIFGKVLKLDNGDLLLNAYAKTEGGMVREQPRPQATVVEDHVRYLSTSLCFRSQDGGENWDMIGTIASPEKDHPFDVGISFSEGFNETGMEVTSDGRLMALMRHGHFMLLWSVFSKDGGRNWTRPQMFSHAGVAPILCRMESGILAAVWGRPGLHIGFSLDGRGEVFDRTVEIQPGLERSQSYLWPVALDGETLRVYYDTSSEQEHRICYRDLVICVD